MHSTRLPGSLRRAGGRSRLSPRFPRPPARPPATQWGRGGSQRPPAARRPPERLPSRRLATAARVRRWREGGRAGGLGSTRASWTSRGSGPAGGGSADGRVRRLGSRDRAEEKAGGRLPAASDLHASSLEEKCETDGWWQENNPGGGGEGAAPGFADAHLGGLAGVLRDSAPAEPRGLAAKGARAAALPSAPLAAGRPTEQEQGGGAAGRGARLRQRGISGHPERKDPYRLLRSKGAFGGVSFSFAEGEGDRAKRASQEVVGGGEGVPKGGTGPGGGSAMSRGRRCSLRVGLFFRVGGAAPRAEPGSASAAWRLLAAQGLQLSRLPARVSQQACGSWGLQEKAGSQC
ncbi:hypothetical protein LEMLEM_LOCUS6801 [Lemmus lemmus]